LYYNEGKFYVGQFNN